MDWKISALASAVFTLMTISFQCGGALSFPIPSSVVGIITPISIPRSTDSDHATGPRAILPSFVSFARAYRDRLSALLACGENPVKLTFSFTSAAAKLASPTSQIPVEDLECLSANKTENGSASPIRIFLDIGVGHPIFIIDGKPVFVNYKGAVD